MKRIPTELTEQEFLESIESGDVHWNQQLGVLAWKHGEGIHSHYEVQAPTLREAIFKAMEKMKRVRHAPSKLANQEKENEVV